MWIIYRLIKFIKNIPKKIKWFFQRGFRGYSDKDIWNIDKWFLNTIIPMLKQLKKEKNGYPIYMTEQQWDIILDNMIDSFKESTDEYCSEKNEYQEEYYNKKYSHIKNIEDLFIPCEDNPKIYKLNVGKVEEPLKTQYQEREEQIKKYKIRMKNKAFRLFAKYFDDLWY